MVLGLREDSDPYLVALETNAPMKKSSDKFKEHKAKVEENYVNYGKAIRSNVAPHVKTAKDHEEMKKAVVASLYHSIMLKDDKVRYQFHPI